MQSDRLLALLLMLQTRPRINAAELARELEVSRRTIYRDIDALSAAGIPVYAERGRNGGCALLPGHRADVSGLSPDEARALFVFGGRGGHPGLEADLRSALRKLLAALPERQRPDAMRAQERVIVEQHGWRQEIDEETASSAAVREAIWADRRLRVRYRAADAETAREQVLDPYGLVVKAGVAYLIAAIGGEPRMYRISRIESADVLDEPSRRPSNLDLEALWGELKSRFESRGDPFPAVARVRDDILPLFRRMTSRAVSELRIGERRDGWTEVTAIYPAQEAAVASFLAFGSAIEALAPESLREAMRAAAVAIASIYEGALGAPSSTIAQTGPRGVT